MTSYLISTAQNFVPADAGIDRQLWSRVDRPMLLALGLLLCLGSVMVASASISFAEHTFGDAFYLFKRHLMYLSIGALAFAGVFSIPVTFWYRHGLTLLFVAVLLLSLVLIPGIGRRVNGAQRWIPLGIVNLQVSELAKMAMIVFIAGYLDRCQVLLRENSKEILRPVGILGLVAALLILEPDFGSVVVLAGTVMGMLFIAGMRLWQFLLMAGGAAGALASLAVLSPYRMQRLVAYLDPWADQYNTGYQLTQSLMAFGRGEWFGVGLGNSVQKLFYLPEAHTDFVFAIFAEEFGLIGVVALIGLFAFLILRVLFYARYAVRRQRWFEAYVCFGVAILLAGQTFINMGVTSGLLPTKGLTLPFISYGGSSLITCMGMMAIVFRISSDLQLSGAGRSGGLVRGHAGASQRGAQP
ncbi:MAG: putative lipid II flippase FtsW [bacterium]